MDISFAKETIGELKNNAGEGLLFNTTCDVADVDGDGLQDIVICPRSGVAAWFKNNGRGPGGGPWERHIIAHHGNIEADSEMFDLTGNGYPDLLAGGDYNVRAVYWFENPGIPGREWTVRTAVETGYPKVHGLTVGDVTHDGRDSLVFWNQGNSSLHRVPIPDDPRISPWPGVRTIAEGMEEDGIPEEGVVVADIDGDGRNEIVAGTHWYKYTGGPGEEWEIHEFAGDYITTKVAVGDIDGDGRNEIVLSEGDACIFTKPEGGKLGWFKPGRDIREPWTEHVLDENLQDPHSLQLGDICGNGYLDIFVGEIGAREKYEENRPRLLVYENDGRGNFTRHVVDEGTGTHEAKLADMRNAGVMDIVGKPLHGREKWEVQVWFNNRA